MNALTFMIELRSICCFHNTGNSKIASNSEIRRWLVDGAIIINGFRPKPFDELEFPITELIMFPKGKRRCTIY